LIEKARRAAETLPKESRINFMRQVEKRLNEKKKNKQKEQSISDQVKDIFTEAQMTEQNYPEIASQIGNIQSFHYYLTPLPALGPPPVIYIKARRKT